MKKSLLLSFASTLFVSLTAHAQSTPPIKKGLWQTSSVSKMTGLTLPPEIVQRLKQAGRPVPGEPTTTVMQQCLTAEKWKEDFAQAQGSKDCHMQNLKQTSSSLTADINCTGAATTSTGHMELNFVSAEKMHGTMHAQVISKRQPQPIVMDVTYDSVYQGSDCKGVSPDDPKLIE